MPAKADRRIAAVAEAAGVSERTARRWRDTGDERFARHTPDRIKLHPPGTAAAASEPTDEVGRLQKLAADLSARINLDDHETRSDLVTDYTRVCEALRKMRGDRPGFEQDEGRMVPVDEADKIMAARDAALIPLLRGMSFRLAPVCAGLTAAEIQSEIEKEVGQIMRQVEAAL